MKPHRSSERWRDVANYQARLDHAAERTVEAALDLQRHCGTGYAARYLDANDISLQVALRTLTRPAQRRRLVME
ncbi:hypothetical protein [Massilia soli]|uniref:Uncharacterized protein n=1 Tax=Massilia soli TaxID=2792854 RepID=A0ABS7SLW6_9BURK|nr:hypothetical protein [Massilia soli]MBZ2207174.1 hypothetical protein [Massilia soli]